MIHYIGTTFPKSSQWYEDEIATIQSVREQIERKFPADKNLFINTTWFGPQFDNGEYDQYRQLVAEHQQFDRVVLLAAADPVFINPDQIKEIVSSVAAKELYLIGHFDSDYQFNFHSIVLQKYFKSYAEKELIMEQPDYVFLNYNRKPRGHRIELVNLLVEQNLAKYGVITLGQDDGLYSQGLQAQQQFTLNEQPEDYAGAGNWNMPMTFGIPHDIHSLGNMDIWRRHFLTVVSETEFYPWDNLFVSEKTWKPIIGLRPFLINGQTQVYEWLRQQGFRTFNHYWPDIEIESVPEYQVHSGIAKVIHQLSQLSKHELADMYSDMLPDLLHNQKRFTEFAQEQTAKVKNIL